MNILKRAAAVLSAAAIASGAVLSASAAEAEEHIVALNYGSTGRVLIPVEDGASLYYTLADIASGDYQRMFSLLYPEPENGKAVIGWKASGSSESYDLYSKVTEDIELTPVTADTVKADTFDLTVDASVLPEAGKAIPEEIKDKITVPEGFAAVSAFYKGVGDETAFKDNTGYSLCVNIMPEDGRVFDFTYTDNDIMVLSVEGATVNGSKANVNFAGQVPGTVPVTVMYPVTLGEPETVKLTLHYGGHGGAEDKTVSVPASLSSEPYAAVSQAAGEAVPYEEGYVFMGWYSDPDFKTFAGKTLFSVELTGDTELYARWARVIDKLDFTVETPLCGDEVKLSNGEELDDLYKTLDAGWVGLNSMEDRQGNPIVLTNEPEISCSSSGVKTGSGWIVSDVPIDRIRISTDVELFTGTLYGENEYMFVLNAYTEGEEDVFFSKDLVITVNGTVADFGSGGARPSTKAGIVSKATVVSKGGNSFTVIGMITADHVWDDGVITKAPGCEETGVKTFTCRSKDASYDDEVDAYGHKWMSWEVVKPATETEDGLEMRRCSNDGEHTETRVIPKTGPADSSSAAEKDSSSAAPQNTGNTGNTGGGNTGGAAADNTQNSGTGAAAATAAALTVTAAAVLTVSRRKK